MTSSDCPDLEGLTSHRKTSAYRKGSAQKSANMSEAGTRIHGKRRGEVNRSQSYDSVQDVIYESGGWALGPSKFESGRLQHDPRWALLQEAKHPEHRDRQRRQRKEVITEVVMVLVGAGAPRLPYSKGIASGMCALASEIWRETRTMVCCTDTRRSARYVCFCVCVRER